MSSYSFTVHQIRTVHDDDAWMMCGMIAAAYRQTGAPKAPRGMRVAVHISTSATDRDYADIEGLVVFALQGVAWEHRSSVKEVHTSIGEEEDQPGWTHVWVELEDGNE